MLLKYETLWGVGSSAKSLEYFDKGGQRRGCELSRGGRDMRAARGLERLSDSRATSGEKQRTLRRRTAKETLHLTVAQLRTKATGLLRGKIDSWRHLRPAKVLGSH